MTTTLANIARTLHGNLTRNELKVVRARLRRLGLTNLTGRVHGPYTVNPSSDVIADVRAVEGTAIVAAIAEAA